MASGVIAGSWRRRTRRRRHRLARVGQVGLRAVADVEQVAEHLHRVALLAFAEQRRHRHAQVLAEQVEQRRLDAVTAWMVVRRSKVCSPRPPASRSAKRLCICCRTACTFADRLADDQRRGILQRLADLLAARHFADAGAAGAVGEDQQVAREERAVRAAQVEQHAVAAGDGDRLQRGDDGGGALGHRCVNPR
jgi:hypothetical protein